MKRLAFIAALAATSVFASAQTVVYDSIGSSGTPAFITSGSSPRVSYGFNLNDVGGGTLQSIAFAFSNTANAPTFDARYRIWGTTNWAATGVTPALSNLLFTSIFSFANVAAGGHATTDIDVSAANFNLPNGNIGVSIEFFTTGSTTVYIPADGVTPVFQTAPELIGTHTDGFVRDGATAPNIPTGTYLGQDLRNFGAPNNHAVFATRLRVVPEPASIAALGLGVLGLLVRRRRSKKA